MNLLHISDMHFGTRHWTGNDELLLEKINSYCADIVLNTGDNTSDALESEFEAAGKFLKSIKCNNVISIAGNHDKRNMRSRDFFSKYIDDMEVIRPLNPESCNKGKIYLDDGTTGIEESFTDINFIEMCSINGKSLLVVCLDTNELYQDNGFVDKEMIRSVSHQIEQLTYDEIILLNHHSILDTDYDPLFNSGRIIEFVRKHNIEHVFCGHTHKLELMKSIDLYRKHSFNQYKNGSLSAHNPSNDSNMFLFYENFGEKAMKVHLIRIFVKGDQLKFEEEVIAIN
ncbi:MAG: metallophosphoesterase [Gammaproteobacteria bacterium]|nr:MAG: metallophosphoesterase [Gammaproteobacteria bacterium]